MKDLHCRDMGSRWFTLSGYWNCDYIARGTSNEEILASASAHAKAVHSMTIPAAVTREAASLIHDETSDAHRRSMGSAETAPA